MADTCPLCREPVPHGRDMTWPAVFGTLAGFWRGYIWVPGGFAHRRCFDALADTWALRMNDPYPERRLPDYCWRSWPPRHTGECGCGQSSGAAMEKHQEGQR